MMEQRAVKTSARDRLRRVCTWCAASVITLGLAGVLTPAVAQNLPWPHPGEMLQISGTSRDSQPVFGMQLTLKELTRNGELLAEGRVRFWRSLCAARYHLRFTYTTSKGRRKSYPYPARLRRGRLDGVAVRCPFAGLPRRGFESMRLRATIDGRPLLQLRARPSRRRGDPLSWLRMPELVWRRANTQRGVVSIVIHARYGSRRSHTVTFIADTDVFSPRP